MVFQMREMRKELNGAKKRRNKAFKKIEELEKPLQNA